MGYEKLMQYVENIWFHIPAKDCRKVTEEGKWLVVVHNLLEPSNDLEKENILNNLFTVEKKIITH